MRKLFRSICFVLLASVLMSTLPFGIGIAAENENLLTSSQEGLLRYLNVTLNGDVISYDKEITRGEMAHILAKVTNANAFSGSESYYYDVPMEYLYADEILSLTDMGVFRGDGNGYFRPDETVSEAEIEKMFVAALGYDDLKDMASYQQTARRIGVADGVTLDGVVTYEEALLMAYNTLHCSMLEWKLYGADGSKGLPSQEIMAIEAYHGLIYQKGIVDGVPGTTLILPDDSIPEGHIKIDGTLYVCNNHDDLLGYSVEFYVKKSKSDSLRPEVAYIHANDYINRTLVIQAEDVIGKIANNQFSYYVNSNEKTVKIVEVPDVIYNGIAYPEYVAADLKPGTGSVTLIDHDNDDVYDVISISTYEYVVIDSVNTNDQIIYGRYPKKEYGSAERDYEMVLKHGSLNAYLGSLKRGDVVAIKTSKNTTGSMKISVERVLDSVTGPIEGISGNDYIIAGKVYERIDGTTVDSELKLGDTVTAYSHNGVCAAIIHAENDSYQYGYIVGVADMGTAFSSEIHIKLVNRNNEMVEYTLGKKVVLDEKSVNTSKFDNVAIPLKTAAAISYRTGAENLPYAQVVRYRLNNDGVITHLDTATYDQSVESKDSLQLSFSEANEGVDRMMWNGANQVFNIAPTGSSERKIAFHATDIWGLSESDRDDIKYWKYKSLTSGTRSYTRSSGTFEAYNIDPVTKLAALTLMYETEGQSVSPAGNYSQKPGIVTGLDQVLNEEGEVVTRINLIGISGGITSYPVARELEGSVATLKEGDIIDIAVSKGEIVVYTLIYSVDSGMVAGNPYTKNDDMAITDYARALRLAYGTAVSYQDGFLRHTTTSNVVGVEEKDYAMHYSYKLGGVDVFIYDTQNPDKGIQNGSINDLRAYEQHPDSTQKTILCAVNSQVSYLYIIK